MAWLTPRRQCHGRESGAMTEWGGHPLARLRREFDEMMDRFFGELPEGPAWVMDIEDRDDEVVVHAAAPGFEPGAAQQRDGLDRGQMRRSAR